MEDYFIQKLTIKDVRDIKNLEIPLDDNERKHLIITGKNGCGKTSTLLEINRLFNFFINNGFNVIESYNKNIETYQKVLKQRLEQKSINRENIQNDIDRSRLNIKSYQKKIDELSNIEIFFSDNKIHENIKNRKFILAYFASKRENKPTVSTAIQNIGLAPTYNTDTNSLHTKFIQYMVKLRADMLDAKEEGENEEVQRIKNWFDNFENSLKELFREESLKIKYYREELNFKIEYNGKSFGLNELSDGYSSLLAIVTELILRMEAHGVKAYDMQGVVLIDEIETHLHVDLQKKVLPFLTSFFPKIQFIVTTHSPFVLSSLSNAVICDLEKKIVVEDLSGHSYESLVDTYFDTDKYSQEVKNNLKRYKILTLKDIDNTLEKSDFKEYLKLEIFFENLPKYKNEEIGFQFNRIQQLKLGL